MEKNFSMVRNRAQIDFEGTTSSGNIVKTNDICTLVVPQPLLINSCSEECIKKICKEKHYSCYNKDCGSCNNYYDNRYTNCCKSNKKYETVNNNYCGSYKYKYFNNFNLYNDSCLNLFDIFILITIPYEFKLISCNFDIIDCFDNRIIANIKSLPPECSIPISFEIESNKSECIDYPLITTLQAEYTYIIINKKIHRGIQFESLWLNKC